MKNIIITGTSRGIGFELAQLFANANHQVLALSRNTDSITTLNHKNITALSTDLSNEDDLKKVSGFVSSHWNQVDIIIHNAGMLVNKPFAELSTQDYINVYKVNVFGVAELTKSMLPFLQKGSHVVTISSMGGIQGSLKFPGLAAYSSSKGALNVLALGAVQTEMLEEAFPGYQAPTSAKEMANYIFDFSLTGNQYYNGKVLQVSSTNP